MAFSKSENERVRILCYLVIGGTVCHYIATNCFVFDSGVRYSRKKEFSLVLIVSTLGLLLNLLLMRLFVGALGGSVMPSKILASALVTIWNYLSRKKWIYS